MPTDVVMPQMGESIFEGTITKWLKKLGDKVQLERFEGDGHALFVDDPEKFNRVLEEFIQSLSK